MALLWTLLLKYNIHISEIVVDVIDHTFPFLRWTPVSSKCMTYLNQLDWRFIPTKLFQMKFQRLKCCRIYRWHNLVVVAMWSHQLYSYQSYQMSLVASHHFLIADRTTCILEFICMNLEIELVSKLLLQRLKIQYRQHFELALERRLHLVESYYPGLLCCIFRKQQRIQVGRGHLIGWCRSQQIFIRSWPYQQLSPLLSL